MVQATTSRVSARETGAADGDQIRRLSHASTNDKVLALATPYLRSGSRVLDLGAGEGYFSSMVGAHLRRLDLEPATVLSACDVVPEQFRYDGVRCEPIGSDGRLPWDAETFDLVCSLEVIEHVEDQFGFLREAYRVLKPGGTLIVSTPNVLNMNSRWRTLHSGFAVLFDPLPLSTRDVVHTSGHIHPVSYYYLAFAMRAARFRSVAAHYDRFKRSALFQLVLLSPLLALGRLGFILRMRRKRPQEMRENEDLLAPVNSFGMLTSRSVIAVATK